MNLSRDSVLALQRHFLGALSAPARTWLEPSSVPHLAFTGRALRMAGGATVLDFGTVDSPGEERQIVRVCNPGAERIDVRIGELPPWVTARWIDGSSEAVRLAGRGEGVAVELTARHDSESDLRGSLPFLVGEECVEELALRMTTRRVQPIAQFDFNGSPVPSPFDFGDSDRPYELTVGNGTSVPLVLSFADLPAWLTFEVDGSRRAGPQPGRFFERTAPFAVRIRPQFIGRHDGVLRMQTNDPRPELQSINLQFGSCLEPSRPHVRALAPIALRLRLHQAFTTEARLENWGRSPARIGKKTGPPSLAVPGVTTVPGSHNGRPGTATLPIRIVPSHLAPGIHTLSLVLKVDGGDPAEVEVPVHIDVAAAELRPPVRVSTVMAFCALLLVTLLFFVLRGLS